MGTSSAAAAAENTRTRLRPATRASFAYTHTHTLGQARAHIANNKLTCTLFGARFLLRITSAVTCVNARRLRVSATLVEAMMCVCCYLSVPSNMSRACVYNICVYMCVRTRA